jgi:hypothetical protein
MRDLDVADLDGDGRKEIVAATSSGLVVALDCQCRKRWARRLASAPSVLACRGAGEGAAGAVVVGCEDGRVVVLDAAGRPVRRAEVRGRPTCVCRLPGPARSAALVLATRKGQVRAFRLAD